MAGYTPEQLRNARILAAASRRPIIRKAILEAGLVEANLTDPAGGDRDSSGGLQQRPSQGWGPASESLATDASQFVAHAKALLARGFRGSAGELAQAVQHSGFPARYAARSSQADALLGRAGGAGSGGGSGATALIDAGGGPSAAPDLNGTDVSGAVAALLSSAQPSAPPVSMPAPTAHSAQAVMPQGYAPPSSGGPAQAPAPDVGALLDAVRTQRGGLPASGGSGAGGGVYTGSGATSGGGSVSSGRAPVAASGPLKLIGRPYTGTHTLGNWQSDRAYDIAVPKGTPMVALQDGQVVKVTRHPQGAGRFAGDQITIRGANGNEYFYAHGVAGVKAGQTVRKGEQLGVTGSANGVEHLHFAQMRGDPSMHLRRR